MDKILKVTPKGKRYYGMCATVDQEGDVNIIETRGDPYVLNVIEQILDTQDELPMTKEDYLEGRYEWHKDNESYESYFGERSGLDEAIRLGLVKEVPGRRYDW